MSHDTTKTISILGAAPGLDASIAARFAPEGYRSGLVLRGAASLAERNAAGIEVAPCPVELTNRSGLLALARSPERAPDRVEAGVPAAPAR